MNSWDEKKELALSVPIDRIMESEGYCRVNKPNSPYSKYYSPFRMEKEPSFIVYCSENRWVDYGLAEEHIRGDGINLVRKLKGFGFKEAVEYLAELSGRPLFTQEYITRKTEVTLSLTHFIHRVDYVRELSYPPLVSYLQNTRKIPVSVARKWCKEVHYTHVPNGRRYFGIGMRNDAGGWAIRTAPYSGKPKGQKIDILASGITTIRHNKEAVSPQAYLFEGFLNFLSWVVLYGEPDQDVIILNSAINSKLLEGLFYTGTRVLVCFPDNDERGRRTYDDIVRISGCHLVDCSDLYKREGLNDLNDYLVSHSVSI